MTNILVVSRDLIPSVKLCVLSELEYLSKTKEIEYRFVASHLITSESLSWCDMAIFVRSDSAIELFSAKQLKKKHKHLVYVLDDDLLNVPDYLDSSEFYNSKDTRKYIVGIMRCCDTLLSPSKLILDKYKQYFNKSYLIKEPALNFVDAKRKNKNIRIGFAGSYDRSKDIEDELSEALIYIHKKYKDVEIEFMGAKPLLVDKLGLKYFEFVTSYDEYSELMKARRWDIGLAPMPKDDFHAHKYINKYIEYSSFGIPAIYSNVEPYSSKINDKENGLLSNGTTENWIKNIELLINDDDLRLSILNNAKKDILKNYNIEAVSNELYKYIFDDYEFSGRMSIKNMWQFRIKTVAHRMLYKIIGKNPRY